MLEVAVLLDALFEALGFEHGGQQAIEVFAYQLLALVRHGLGVAVVPDPIARRSGLPRVALRPGPPSRRLALVGRSPAPPANPAAREFLALLDPPGAREEAARGDVPH